MIFNNKGDNNKVSYRQFDREKIKFYPLAERMNKVDIERERVTPDMEIRSLSRRAREAVKRIAEDIVKAKENGKSVVMAFGAHTIKNGLGPLLIEFIQKGWINHLATNGAGIIHDWEFAYQGKSSEDVRANVRMGRFGIWEETGFYLNLAIDVGAYLGLGYGESVGAMVFNDGLNIPDREELLATVEKALNREESNDYSSNAFRKASAAAELLYIIEHFNIDSGFMEIKHRYKQYGLQAAAFRLNVPYTAHPMFGHDIIYTHPLNNGPSIGRTAERDFLTYAGSISNIDGGVYLSIGSAVMSPMIFEKSLSMAQNIALREGHPIKNHKIYVVDLAEYTWDWQKDGEPPQNNPAYYLRYCKTFSRMGGTMEYIQADNRDFLLSLYRELTSFVE